MAEAGIVVSVEGKVDWASIVHLPNETKTWHPIHGDERGALTRQYFGYEHRFSQVPPFVNAHSHSDAGEHDQNIKSIIVPDITIKDVTGTEHQLSIDILKNVSRVRIRCRWAS